MNHIKQFRILAVFLSTRGFGYAVMEGENTLIDYGNKVVQKDKNVHSLAQIQKVIRQNQPDVLVLLDVMAKGVHRAQRIKELHLEVVALSIKRKLKVVTIGATGVRSRLLGELVGSKHEMAELLARRFPDELASRLPPKRRTWESEDARMDIFEAVALAVVFRMKGKIIPVRGRLLTDRE